MVNCWEFMKCENHNQVSCSAFLQKAGRKCWLVAGTLCGGAVQCLTAQKLGSCKVCAFYQNVKAGTV